MDIEGSLLAKAIAEENLTPILDARVTEDFFEDKEHALVFRWMLRYWREHQQHPTRRLLDHEFPEYRLEPCPEPYDYYLDEIREDRRYGILADLASNLKDALSNQDTTVATKTVEIGLNRLHNEVQAAQDTDFAETTKKRMEYYMTVRAHNGMLGIPTGFKTMDQATGGLQKGQLVTLVGPPKVGKSVFLMMMSIAAHDAGNKVLGVTFEMSNDEQSWRHDAFRAHVNYNHLTRGQLDGKERGRLKVMFKKINAMREFVWVHDPSSAITVSALGAKCLEHKPDLLVVDGVYMMQTELPGVDSNSAMGLTNITRSLKRLAKKLDIPIVITTQVLPGKFVRRQGVTIDSIGYTSSFAQDSDVIFGVEDIPDNNVEVYLRIVAARNTAKRKVRVSFDWENGTIEELDDSDFEEGDQVGDDRDAEGN